MRRRAFIALIGSAAAWPLAARAQQPAAGPVVGFVHGGSQQALEDEIVAFEQGLRETGYVPGKNVTVEYRWAEGQYDRLPELAANLVRRQVAVIATGTPVAALATKEATKSIPIVFALGSDPVKDGLVANLNRPGGNITGATFFNNLLVAKRMELLHQLVPNAKIVSVLLNPKNANVELETNRGRYGRHHPTERFDLLLYHQLRLSGRLSGICPDRSTESRTRQRHGSHADRRQGGAGSRCPCRPGIRLLGPPKEKRR